MTSFVSFPFYIFGTGFIAERLSRALIFRKENQYLSGYIVTKRKDAIFMGQPVYQADEITDKDRPVIVAVHEAIKDEIFSTLRAVGFQHVSWLSPDELLEVELGKPLRTENLPVKEIFQNNITCLGIGARLAAIEAFYGKRKNGYDLYLQVFSCLNLQSTSEQRLQKFIDLIRIWDAAGYDADFPSSVLEDGLILDGTHRFALAVYHRLNELKCQIYKEPPFHMILLDRYPTEEYLIEQGVGQKVINELNEINHLYFCRT